MSRPVLTVVSNADEKFFPGLAVAVASAVAAASGKYDYHFLILDGGLRPESVETLNTRIAKIAVRKDIYASLEILPVDQTRLRSLPERRGSRMTYAKLVLPEILPQLDSIVYLDGDVLCFSGLEAVHPLAGEANCLLAGARDFFSVIAKDCPWLDQVPPAERQLPYLNCGVLWMNLTGLREIDFTHRSIAARAAVGEARQGDQSVFNFLCRGRCSILPESVNHRTSIGSSKALCEGSLDLNLHYIGAPKPWLGPPKTSNWLAHQLWHQARAMLFPETGTMPTAVPPHDRANIRRKALLYSLLNPPRAAHYRSDLSSLRDPSGLMATAQNYWESTLGI